MSPTVRPLWTVSAAWRSAPATAEGGPAPDEVTTIDPALVGVVAGHFASHAGLPPVPGAPGVRPIQRTQLEVALPWVVKALG